MHIYYYPIEMRNTMEKRLIDDSVYPVTILL